MIGRGQRGQTRRWQQQQQQQHGFVILWILSFVVMKNLSTVMMMEIQSQPTSSTDTTTTKMPAVNKTSSPYPRMQNAMTENDNGQKVTYKKNDNGDTLVSSVPTILNYVTPNSVSGTIGRDTAGCDSAFDGVTWDPATVPIYNAFCQQQNEDRPTLDEHGYELLDDASIFDKNDDGTEADTTGSSSIDFIDSQSVIDLYYPHCEALLQKHLLKISGTTNKQNILVKAFDHNIRKGSSVEDNDEKKEDIKGSSVGSKVQPPIGIVHGDYTKVSAPRRLQYLGQPPKANDVLKDRLGSSPLLDPKLVQDTLGEDFVDDNDGDDDNNNNSNAKKQKMTKKRFAFINVWRSIDMKHPIQQYPLACMNAQTFTTNDMKTLQIYYTDRIAENYLCSHNSKHKWNYFANMTHKQVLLIKQWDSFGSINNDTNNNDDNGSSSNKKGNISPFAFHTAFADPTSPKNAKPRQSIEVRCVIIWDDDDDNNNNNAERQE